ncbi:MAG: hypothetical protein ACOCYX_05815 [Spirochaetota bacterium]
MKARTRPVREDDDVRRVGGMMAPLRRPFGRFLQDYQERRERQRRAIGGSEPASPATYQRDALLLRWPDVLTHDDARTAEPPVTRRERRTFAFDSIRIATDGVGVSLIQTVTLVIAIKVFAAPDALKSLLASAANIGQLASLFVTAALARRAIRPNSIASAMGPNPRLSTKQCSRNSRPG